MQTIHLDLTCNTLNRNPVKLEIGLVLLWLGGAVWVACVKHWGKSESPKLLCVAVKRTH